MPQLEVWGGRLHTLANSQESSFVLNDAIEAGNQWTQNALRRRRIHRVSGLDQPVRLTSAELAAVV